MKHIQSRIPAEQHTALKLLSVKTGESLQTLVAKAIDKFLQQPTKPEEQHHGQEERR